jgi:hypothetical protein
MAIQIRFEDDNGTSAPLYKVYPRQLQPQPTYLEFDPRQDGDLVLTAGYSGELGGGIPMLVFEGKIHQFTVPAAVRRDALVALADDAELAALLERVRAGYRPDYGRAAYTVDAYSAMEEIESRLSGLDLAEVWDAASWVEQTDLSELLRAGSVEALAQECEVAVDPSTQVIDGDIAAALAKLLAGKVDAYIGRHAVGDADYRRAAVILRDYDAAAYSYLVETYDAEFGE